MAAHDATEMSRRLARPGIGSLAGSLAPSAAFLAADRWAGIVVAMAAASAVSAALVFVRCRRGQGIGKILPVSLAYVVVRAVVGLVTESEIAFFGLGIGLSVVVTVAVGATALTRYPAASYFLPHVVPYRHLTPEHPAFRRVSAQVTVAWALAELAGSAWETRHLLTATASDFVIARTFLAWPVMAGVIFVLIFFVRFRLDPVEWHLGGASSAGQTT